MRMCAGAVPLQEADVCACACVQAQFLSKKPMGESLLWTCGSVYESKGLQGLGGIEGFSAGVKQVTHTAAAQMRVAGAAVRTYRAAQKERSSES